MDYGQRIKEARISRELTRKELASIMNVAEKTIYNYETNKAQVTIDFLATLSEVLSIDYDYLVQKKNKSMSISQEKNVHKLSISESITSTSPQESLNHQKVVHQSSKSCLPIYPSPQDAFFIPKLNITASAGGGNNLEGLECYESGDLLAIDKAFFKTPPSKKIKAIKVDGYSMIPMLFPDSWVIFEETREFKGDGLYIINYQNQLMVKLLQLNPFDNVLKIISVNKDYESYSYKCEEGQELLFIQGKVLRSII